jgi:hypothetical protein
MMVLVVLAACGAPAAVPEPGGSGDGAAANSGTDNPVPGLDADAAECVFGPKVDGDFFGDVRGHWASEFVLRLAAEGVVAGFPDGTFRPDDPVTRAQFAAIVVRAFDPAPVRDPLSFSDVPADHWARAYIDRATQGGFLNGYPDGTFGPARNVTRQEALVALAKGLGLGGGYSTLAGFYDDAAAVAGWAQALVGAATLEGLVVNHPARRRLEPVRAATRAEIAAFVHQGLVRQGTLDPVAAPEIVPSPAAILAAAEHRSRAYGETYATSAAAVSPNPSFPDNARPDATPLTCTQGYWKCNMFAGDVVYEAGFRPPQDADGWYHLSQDWHLDTSLLDVVALSDARPGDLLTIDRGASQNAEGGGHALVLATPVGDDGGYEAISVHSDGAYRSARNVNDDAAGTDDRGQPWRVFALRPRVVR